MKGPEERMDELRDNVAAVTHEELEERDAARDEYVRKGEKPPTEAEKQGRA